MQFKMLSKKTAVILVRPQLIKHKRGMITDFAYPAMHND